MGFKTTLVTRMCTFMASNAGENTAENNLVFKIQSSIGNLVFGMPEYKLRPPLTPSPPPLSYSLSIGFQSVSGTLKLQTRPGLGIIFRNTGTGTGIKTTGIPGLGPVLRRNSGLIFAGQPAKTTVKRVGLKTIVARY